MNVIKSVCWKVQSFNYDLQKDGCVLNSVHRTNIYIPIGCIIFPVVLLKRNIPTPFDFGNFTYNVGFSSAPNLIIDGLNSRVNYSNFTMDADIAGTPRTSTGEEIIMTITAITTVGTVGQYGFNFIYLDPNS